MVKSASTIPHVTNFDDADVTDLERLRKTAPAVGSDRALKLTSLPFVIKAVALALQQHPMLNASIDEEKEEIVYKQYINLGVAVDTPRGLVVPVLRNADRLSILQIAEQVATLTPGPGRPSSASTRFAAARSPSATSAPSAAPTARRSSIIPRWRSCWWADRAGCRVSTRDKIEGRLMMPLSLSYDHRVVDGAAAGRFLNDVIDYLQSPGKLLFIQ